MRLVCPNCDAQYEVDAEAIPEAGRDVQCSNCGNTWFQAPPDLEAEMEAEEQAILAAAAVEQVSPPVSTDAVDDVALADAPPAAVETADDSPPPQEAIPTEPADPVSAPVMPRRGMDESLLAVLREEAEREAAVRRAETPRPLETQPDLGLEETTGAASAAKAVRDRLSRLRAPEPEAESPEKPTARRDLLPDIEEINSTLRASTENRSSDSVDLPEPAAGPQANSGFRSGFVLMLVIAVLLLVTYGAAPKIITQFPALRPALESYVAGVDAARLWLDGAMRSAISALQNLTGGTS